MLTRQQLIEFLGQQPRRVHFIGIGGCGMSGLARLLLQLGHAVTGSDLSANGETTELKKLGAKVFVGHAGKHIHAKTELVVYSSAVNGQNEELAVAEESGIPAVRRGLLLTALMTHQCNIAVAGTHGKTTTAAMLAHVLTRSDSAPTYCVGARVPVLGANAQHGAGKYFVAEACESDGTLIGFTPQYAVCLNIEAEHLDHHQSMDRLLATFETFFRSTLNTVFYCADCPNCVALARHSRAAISFGLSDKADYRAVDIQPTARGSTFTVRCRDQRLGNVELIIPGHQNVVNALAALALADQLGLPFEKVAEALAKFTGAKRRFERRYEGDDIVVVDDYAHHPTEVRATIAAARTLGFQRVIAAFQPHRYTRTQALQQEFATSFRQADRVFLTDIYAASEKPIGGVSGRAFCEAVLATGQTGVMYEPNLSRLGRRLFAEARAGDLVLVMGAGDISKVAQAVAEKLTRQGPNILTLTEPPMNIRTELRRVLSDQTLVRCDEPMSRHTSMRVGGPADVWIEPANERDLAQLLKYCHERHVPVTIVGRGTNLLVRDGGIAGVVIQMANDQLSRIEVDGERLIAGSGARLRSIVKLAKQYEIGGFEFLEGIPGSLGGALRMNAGAMGHQMFEVVEWVRYVSLAGEIYDADAKSLPVSYRSCPLFANHVALSAILRGQKVARIEINARLRQLERRRWSSQPAKPSAGCIFKNPALLPAGKLIDELGLKGTTVGAARVSEMHGNFIVNEGGATAADVLRLMELIRARARQERGIELEPEVMILGREA